MVNFAKNFTVMIPQAKKWVSIWLAIGLVLVLMQVVLGGITRLTDSGLSITEWKLILGVVPPIGHEEWTVAFEQYQTHAKKQFETIHQEMTLAEFKMIYFWEWFHRLWARSMGLIFIFPFMFFVAKKWLPKWLIKDLAVVILLAALAGAMGWIMVVSGLNNDNRTWVSAYKLAAHLLVATALFAYLFNTFLKVKLHGKRKYNVGIQRKLIFTLIVLCVLQIMLGGFMAGMRAGAIHPYWPIFAGNNHLLQIVTNPDLIQNSEVINYEGAIWIKGLVQVLHRSVALLLLIFSVLLLVKSINVNQVLRKAAYIILFFIGLQYTLGVLTILGIIGNKTPVFLGVVHQGTALLFLASLLYYLFLTSKTKKK